MIIKCVIKIILFVFCITLFDIFTLMNGTKSFRDYLGKEDIMHSEIVKGIRFTYQDLFWWHTPNEGKRSEFEQYKFKQLGGDSGIADFVILEESNFSKGLMMEVKCGKNKCTQKQVDFLLRSIKKGYTAIVVYDSAADALDFISQHLKTGLGIPSDGIILIKGGNKSVVPIDQASETLCPKKRASDDKKKLLKLMDKQRSSKFGKALPNKGKLFGRLKND